MTGALAPYRILDLTTERGWLAGRMLADLGADVIKVEPPGGDPGRQAGLFAEQDARDPETNLHWWFHNRGKSSVVLDLATPNGREALLDLVDTCDALIESFAPGHLESLGVGVEALLAQNPSLVVTSITPFGRTGPYAGWSASDLTVAATTGEMWLTGEPDRAPLRVSVPQLFLNASAEGAANAMIALWHAQHSGQGQHVDVSAQLCGMKTLMNAAAWHLLEHNELMRVGSYNGKFRIIYRCSDGYVAMLSAAGPIGGPIMRLLMQWADREGVADPTVKDRDFSTINFAFEEPAFFEAVTSTFDRLLIRHTKAELYSAALEYGLLLAPITTVADLVVDEQLVAREYFVEATMAPTVRTKAGTRAGTVVWPGAWVKCSRTPLDVGRRAPTVGEHTDEVFAASALQRATRRSFSHSVEDGPAPKRPFDGLRVLDLSWVGVGPMTAGYLANYGAQVFKIESSKRPDVLRRTPPFRDGRPDINNSHFFGDYNPNKRSLGLDLGDARGREIAWKAIEWADVIVESFTPKALAGWGMDYAEIVKRKPAMVMLSTCMQGQTGPRRLYRGFGNLMAGLAGFYEVTGWPDRSPVMIYGAHTDFLSQRFACTALVAALDHRRRTGEGQHIDLSQFEAALQFLGPEIIAHTIDGRIAQRCGNRDRDRAPHGVFSCRVESERAERCPPGSQGHQAWVAISCEDDAQWRAVVELAGLPDNPRWRTLAGRKADEDLIEELLARWAAPRRASEIVALLQPRVSAAPVLGIPELHTDPQINHREYWVPLQHPVYGEVPYSGLQATLSKTPGRLETPAPCLGQHSWDILEDTLGIDSETIAMLLAEGVVEITG